jgi:crotonobetainyl-CoA:carnitine CoA-transferase CaiB-like acyl-CoA transferase
MLLEVDHPTAGKIGMIGFPAKLSRTPCRIDLPPPCFAQHTNEILKELNYSEEELTELKQDGII